MGGALEGITVVALEQAVAAPLATSRMADAGARVIKLERAEGDFARGYDDYANGQSSYFVWNNRGKESCVVDLKHGDDLTLVDRMIAKADVFVQNLAPGATDRLGLGSGKLRRRFPRLIVCDVGGFGQGTPDEGRKAYDLLIQAEAGLAGVTGTQASGASRVGISISDISTGQAAYAAVLEALIARGTTGRGAHLRLSLFDTLAEYMNVPYMARRYGGTEPGRLGLAHPSIAPYGVYETRDGNILISIQNDREWETFSTLVLEDANLSSDEKFATNVRRVANREALDVIVQQAFARHTVAGVCELLDRVRIAYGRVSTMAELAAHRSLATVSVDTPFGPIEIVAPPVSFDGKRCVPGRVPALGEHSEALRLEFGEAAPGRKQLAGGSAS